MLKDEIIMNKVEINKKDYFFTGELLETRLIDYLRNVLHLTGTKNGCDIGVCGACTVIIDNSPKKACKTKLKSLINKNVLTIEGMELKNGELHPLQQAFLDAGAIQCGFCTPGMVLSSHALLLKNNKPTTDEIKKTLQGNLCRCTGYQQIFDAVLRAGEYYNNG